MKKVNGVGSLWRGRAARIVGSGVHQVRVVIVAVHLRFRVGCAAAHGGSRHVVKISDGICVSIGVAELGEVVVVRRGRS